MPLSLPAEQTAAPDGLPALSAELDSIDAHRFDAADLPHRVGNVVQLWNVFQHFYPYFDVVDTDWSEVLDLALERSLADTDRRQHHETLSWMVAQLHDGHGSVFDPDRDRHRGRLPLALEWVEDAPVVVAVGSGAPFELGDVLLEIGGRPVLERLAELRRSISGSSRWKTHRALTELLSGPSDSDVDVVVARAGERVRVATRHALALSRPVTKQGLPAVHAFADGVRYVDLGRASWLEIQPFLDELAKAPGVVFDLRGYPRGNHQILQHLTDERLQSARWNKPLQIRPDQADPEWDTSGRWNLPPLEPRIQGRVAFLTGGGAISYAESVMAIVAHYRLAEIFGEATAGANGNVNPFTLPGGFRVAYTGMKVLHHDGSQHHLLGVVPTVPVQPTIAGVRAGRDEVLEQALGLRESAVESGDTFEAHREPMTDILVGTVGSPAMLHGPLEQRRLLVDRVAAVGLDHLFLADHVSFHTGAGMDGLINAATLLAMHPRLKVCVGVYLLALRHPVPVARQIASLSQSAPGRLLFGIGVGGEDRHEIEICGVDPRTRGRRTDECLEVLEGLLGGDELTFDGEFFQFEAAKIVPAPQPPVPVLVGGRSDAAVRRAARFGDGWLGAWCSARRMAEVASVVSASRPPGRAAASWHGLQLWVGFDEDEAAARERLAREMEAFYHVPFAAFERYSPCGTPKQVADFLLPYVEAGCRLFNLKPVAASEELGIDAMAEMASLLRAR